MTVSLIAKTSVDIAVFRIFKKGLKKDVSDGHLSRQEAEDIAVSMEGLRGYADLQFMLYAFSVVTGLFCAFSRPWNVVLTNGITTLWSILDTRVSVRFLHLPGFILLRCVPGISSCIGNIALLRAEPRLYNVALRICERSVDYPILRLLKRVYIRPAMHALRWLYMLDWPHLFAA